MILVPFLLLKYHWRTPLQYGYCYCKWLIIKPNDNLGLIYYNNRVYVRGHKYVLDPTQTHLKKMSLRRPQNIFMPKNINSITINITLEGIEKIKTDKSDNKTL